LATFSKSTICVALEIDLISLAQCQKMGALLSNLSKLDSIINPDVSATTETTNTVPKSEESTQIIDNTVKESDTGAPKEPEPVTIEVEKSDEKPITREEPVISNKKEEGKKVEVEPVDISKTADVIKKPTRKRKRHQME
jgi:hypothetical protein